MARQLWCLARSRQRFGATLRGIAVRRSARAGDFSIDVAHDGWFTVPKAPYYGDRSRLRNAKNRRYSSISQRWLIDANAKAVRWANHVLSVPHGPATCVDVAAEFEN